MYALFSYNFHFRYMRRDGTMRLADFVSAILHLTMAFGKTILLLTNLCSKSSPFTLLSDIFKQKDMAQEGAVKLGLNDVSFLVVL